ncbi:carbohydrate ABC transporter permease [Bifidobacterium crudilactis]|nr:sugar ABC transporter permease [Bifidobacterium crudilactis]MCI1218871.1 sugar ABC transporter permease [Bifidobacterium crudilactis]MCI1638007.1 sugar ABC transporter permease [Bifidobacterium crudilactis]MCI1868581.1 sugar ABC transporter permease [Bifidobacterium crudilactis]MCI2148813.1 sugar ABC transporter permease [Bifidobacterium crudilactis]MCI2158321.1 sugar ABC transporter permease [Bifidobacterium crudilactis]
MRNIAVTALIVYFSIFMVYPIYKAFAGSLHEWNPLVGTYNWVGLDNFKAVLTDGLFWKSLWNTAYFSVFSIVFRIILGLGLALLLSSRLVKAKDSLRGLFYMPTITPLVAVSFVWMWMFDPQFGMINKVTGLDINWLNDSHWALPAIIIMTIWKDFGYATVLYLAGLMNLPRDVYEAAQIDGANSWQTFWRITLPLLKPTTLFIVITSLITYVQAYVQILVMTEGGPGTETYTISYLIFDQAFQKYDFGTASAMSVILFAITGVLTILMFRASGDMEQS